MDVLLPMRFQITWKKKPSAERYSRPIIMSWPRSTRNLKPRESSYTTWTSWNLHQRRWDVISWRGIALPSSFLKKRFENCVCILLIVKMCSHFLGIFRWVGRYCVFVHCGFGTVFEISRLQRSQVSGFAKVNHRSWKIRSWRIRNRAEKSSSVFQNHQQPLAL